MAGQDFHVKEENNLWVSTSPAHQSLYHHCFSTKKGEAAPQHGVITARKSTRGSNKYQTLHYLLFCWHTGIPRAPKHVRKLWQDRRTAIIHTRSIEYIVTREIKGDKHWIQEHHFINYTKYLA